MPEKELVELECQECGDSFLGDPSEEKECLRCGGDLKKK